MKYAIKLDGYHILPGRYITRTAADVDAMSVRTESQKTYIQIVRMLSKWDRDQRDKANVLREAADAVGADLWENETIPREVAKWLRKRADGIWKAHAVTR